MDTVKPFRRTMAWIAVWLCSLALLPLIVLWIEAFRVRLTRLDLANRWTWLLVAGDLFLATSMTVSTWHDRRQLARAMADWTLRDRKRALLAVSVIVLFLVLRIL